MSWVTAGVAVVGGVSKMIMAGKAKRDALAAQKEADRKLKELEENRQDVINPYDEAAQMLSNPFANLQVSTQAAEFQAEQADVALAGSLDTLRATGAGAGGATALAQAALQSQRGISANIAQQEAQTAQMRAQGQAAMEKQLAQFSAAGNQFEFQAQEARENQQLNRLSSLSSSYSQQAAVYGSQEMQGMGAALGGVSEGVIGSQDAMIGYDEWKGIQDEWIDKDDHSKGKIDISPKAYRNRNK